MWKASNDSGILISQSRIPTQDFYRYKKEKEIPTMSKIDEVRKAMVAAMKAGEKERKDSLSMLLSALEKQSH